MLTYIESRLRSRAPVLLLVSFVSLALALVALNPDPTPRFEAFSEANGVKAPHAVARMEMVQGADHEGGSMLSLEDSSVLEGTGTTQTATVEFRLSDPSEAAVTVTYQTADGSALADQDYASQQGSLVFAPGETARSVQLRIIGDSQEEPDERFYVDVTSLQGAELDDGRGGLSIYDNDGSNEGRTLPHDPSEGAPVDKDAPVIQISSRPGTPAATGWYNLASSGSEGIELSVSASDPSGVASLVCKEGSQTLLRTDEGGTISLGDGVHEVTCSAIDQEGNRGIGPGSTPMPALFKVDQTLPALECQASLKFLLNQPSAAVSADVTDATSGPSKAVATAPASTSAVGQSILTTIVGSDRAGNEAATQCAFAVVYRFSGFQPPLKGGTQQEQAGRTIPIKWRISDYYDVGVGDTTSFLTLTTFSDTCSRERSGETPESGPGRSGLQYQGDGNWHFNWKTPRSYAGRCRTLSLNLLDGELDRLGFISFR